MGWFSFNSLFKSFSCSNGKTKQGKFVIFVISGDSVKDYNKGNRILGSFQILSPQVKAQEGSRQALKQPALKQKHRSAKAKK